MTIAVDLGRKATKPTNIIIIIISNISKLVQSGNYRPPAKRHLNAVRWRADSGSRLDAGWVCRLVLMFVSLFNSENLSHKRDVGTI